MACSSTSGADGIQTHDTRQDPLVLDPLLSSWMTREGSNPPPSIDNSEVTTDEEDNKKRDKDSEIEVRELFRIFDKDHDNTIGCGELGKMLRCMGMEVSDDDVEVIMRDLDKNGNGKIEYREFKSFMQEEMRRSEESPIEQERAIRMAFQVFDKTGEGMIDSNELRSALKTLGEPLSEKEFSDMMNLAQVDDNGLINYNEFIKVWLESADQRQAAAAAAQAAAAAAAAQASAAQSSS